MDELRTRQPVPGWFKLAAVGSLLFMGIGCAGYLLDVTSDPDSLPLDQRTLVMARPPWSVAAYGIAVWVGLAGAVLLLIRRRLAEPLLLVSLVAAVFTFLPYAVVPGVRDNVTTTDIAFALAILAITGTIWSFARRSRERGWLR